MKPVTVIADHTQSPPRRYVDGVEVPTIWPLWELCEEMGYDGPSYDQVLEALAEAGFTLDPTADPTPSQPGS